MRIWTYLRLLALLAVLLPAGRISETHAPCLGAAWAAEIPAADAPAETVSAEAASGMVQAHEASLGERLPLWSVIPFVGILLSIALLPLLTPHFWHRHFGKVAATWSLLFILPFALAYGWHAALSELLRIGVVDYLPFIILLTGLFVIAGGIAVKGSLSGTPRVNTVLLLIGTLLASWIGTTGASMLMIRPVLRSNAHRRSRAHVVIFFIFLVSNIGGALTPIGDPPLFLGFLHGVPFFWTLAHCLQPMLLNVAILLILFYLLDSWLLKKEGGPRREGPREPLRIEGLVNLLLLAGVIGAVIGSGLLAGLPPFVDAAGRPGGLILIAGAEGVVLPTLNLLRDGTIILMLLLSLKLTRRATREANEFNWEPILEVAKLFAGIFVTIVPALEILKAGSHGALAFIIERVSSDASYFWASGSLSSFLDNAPTYLTFFNTAQGSLFPGLAEATAVPLLIARHPVTLMAISCGAVFMGANSYIGNAPNFMVKAMAEQAQVKMPSFFGYMAWSVGILIPLFILDTWLFF